MLEELKTDYANLLDKEKPEIIFVQVRLPICCVYMFLEMRLQNESDIVEGKTLEELLHRHGPFPLEEHIAARILRGILTLTLERFQA